MNKMLKIGSFCAVSFAVLLSGCATSPIPEGYVGPIATVQDSSVRENSNRTQFFYVAEVNGNKVDNALVVTRKANHGRGFQLTAAPYSREIPANQVTLTLNGNTEYGAPIQALLNAGSLYSATRKVTFVPGSNKTYVVKGTLTETTQDVWLEEVTTGKRVEAHSTQAAK
jgi:hypothetical protein